MEDESCRPRYGRLVARPVQVRTLRTTQQFLEHLAAIDVELPFDADVRVDGPLAHRLQVFGRTAGNRFAILPMEGWDGTDDGLPTDLVRRRWRRFGASGAGLVWGGEAVAVRADGRANPRQLAISPAVGALRTQLLDAHPDPGHCVVGLQLTHSGRFAQTPRVAYEHPYLDARVGRVHVLTDAELDDLVGDFVRAAVIARDAGFDFVDVKHCHGYLLHELLSARTRPGAYGGELDHRTHFLRTVVAGIRARAPRLAVAVRVSVFDLVPFGPGPDGRGVPEHDGTPPYRHAFGGDGSGLGVDLTEAHAFCTTLTDLGIGLVSVTAGSPYYNPHVQRPAYFPPSDGYRPPEDPLVGVARHLAATAELAHAHPALTFVGGAYSYLQDWLPNVAQAVVARGDAAVVGLGRMMLSYPTLARDILEGRPLDTRSICRTFSDCTTAPRAGL